MCVHLYECVCVCICIRISDAGTSRRPYMCIVFVWMYVHTHVIHKYTVQLILGSKSRKLRRCLCSVQPEEQVSHPLPLAS